MSLKHVGLIMDGNGRWAVRHGLKRAEGYAYGLKALNEVANAFSENGVEVLTVYAFSTENNKRPEAEISAIFDVVTSFNLNYNGEYKIRYMGAIDLLPTEVSDSVKDVEERTKENRGLTLNIALNYGGREDVISAAKKCYDSGVFSKSAFEKNLSSFGLPPLDLIVRTGGEKRLSGFMLYESAYSELIFIDKLFPDMNGDDVTETVAEFNSRNRKFGK